MFFFIYWKEYLLVFFTLWIGRWKDILIKEVEKKDIRYYSSVIQNLRHDTLL